MCCDIVFKSPRFSFVLVQIIDIGIDKLFRVWYLLFVKIYLSGVF